MESYPGKETMYQTDVLVFGTMGRIGQDVQRLLAARGLRTVAVPFPQNVFCDEPGYRRMLVNAMGLYMPEAVFPIGNPLAMARFKGLVEQGVPLVEILNRRKTEREWEEAVQNATIVVEKEETVRLLDSKVSCYQYAERLGIPQPEVYARIEDIPDENKIIFKRDISFGGHGVHKPKYAGALRNLIARQKPGEPFLMEEFLDGQDFSMDAVRCGSHLYMGAYLCLSSHGDNGPSLCREVLHEGDSRLEEMQTYVKVILENLDYQGVCGFDFRTDSSGKVRLLECNPRFTGGVSDQAAAGFDIPWQLYKSFML